MQSTFNYQGTEIFYSQMGQGIPVVLLHGFGEDSSIWANQLPEVSELAHIITVDLPGSGKSPFNPKLSNSISKMAAMVAALLDSLDISKVIILGHSMGGYITMAFAKKFPNYLLAIGLIHSTAQADSPDKVVARQKGIASVEQYGAAAFLKLAIPNLFAPNFLKEYKSVVNNLITASEAFSNQAIIAYYEAMITRKDTTSYFYNASIPVLFVIGLQDLAVDPKDVMPQTYIAPVSFVHILPHVAHMSMLESPKELNSILVNFIQHINNKSFV